MRKKSACTPSITTCTLEDTIYGKVSVIAIALAKSHYLCILRGKVNHSETMGSDFYAMSALAHYEGIIPFSRSTGRPSYYTQRFHCSLLYSWGKVTFTSCTLGIRVREARRTCVYVDIDRDRFRYQCTASCCLGARVCLRHFFPP